MTHYAFYFDSNSCSGCKACQVACKDKHGLEVGRLWRRVYEVSGGGWRQEGAAWLTDAFAYNLSIACNHCEKPACKEACPAGAIYQRADGIVLIDGEHCMGCQYCSWACPYGAPQYDAAAGRMSKCTFCVDLIEVGLSPACVAACPLRALDFGDLDELRARYETVEMAFPLPAAELTRPALALRPHRDVGRARAGTAWVNNGEEVNLG
jgi:DMSO reductase iron-sulfur subunit